MIALRVAKGVRTHLLQRLPEWFLATHLGLVGAQLIRTDETFRTSQAYRVIASYVSETAWSMAALSISSFWMTALILNGSFAWFSRWSRWVRSLSAFVVSGFWSVTAVGVFESAPMSPAVVNNAGYAVMAFVVSLVTAHECGAADKRATYAASRSE